MALVEAGPEPIRRAVHLQRALEVAAPLAWRLFRIAGAPRPLDAASFVPKRGEIGTFVSAVKRKKWSRPHAERIQSAYAAYERLVLEHASDRRTFDAMLASLRTEDDEGIDERTRKGAYEHNMRIWGVTAKMVVRAMIISPKSPPGISLGATVSGYVDMHAIRPGLPLVLRSGTKVMPISGSFEDDQVPIVEDRPDLVAEFNSPSVEQRTDAERESATTSTRIVAPGIGKQASMTVFAAKTVRCAWPEKKDVGNAMIQYTPTERVALELWLPAGWSDPSSSRISFYGRRDDIMDAFQHRPVDLMPIRETVTCERNVLRCTEITEIPRWPDIVGKVLDELDCRNAPFDVYRCVVSYPVLHTVVSLRADISQTSS